MMEGEGKLKETKMQPNISEIKQFKRFFHGDNPAVFQMYSKKKGGGRFIYKKLIASVIEQLLQANDDGFEIAMLINHSDTGGRKNEDIGNINSFYVDFDDKKITLENILNLPVKPHLVTETSPGNYHAYWLVDDCCLDVFPVIQYQLAVKLGGDTSVRDPSRVMRVPGTTNWKRDKPFLSRIVYIDENAKPVRRNFEKLMGLENESEAKRAAGDKTENGHCNDCNLKAYRSKLKEALNKVSSDPYHDWLKVGMAIHNDDSTSIGYNMWTNWSKKSKKFDEKVQKKTWRAFKINRGLTIGSIFWLANKSASKKALKYNESTLSDFFSQTANATLRFNIINKSWYEFDGVIWKKDNSAPNRRIRNFIKDLISVYKDDEKSNIKNFATVAQYSSLTKHSELIDEMSVDYELFDKNPLLLAVGNGVIDLNYGAYQRSKPSYYLTRASKVIYDEEAKCPIWVNFLKQVVKGDKQLYKFIQRALGYSITGNTDLQLFFVAIGSGSNGKGVLMRTVTKIMGSYAKSVAPNLMTSAYSGNANGPSDALANLHGCRLTICTELPSGKRFDEAFIKQYAGGDEITARPSYGEVFTFKPEGKLWISTNDLPEISATDEAMWRRIKPIPFNAKFTGTDVDPKLEEKLIAEHPGILNWLISGARDYSNFGLGSCKAVDNLIQKMRHDADSVLSWLDECCITGIDLISPAGLTYDSYDEFMRNQHRKPYSSTVFKIKLIEKGYIHSKKKTGNVWSGFKVKPTH